MVKKNMKEEKKEAILPLWFRILGTIYIIFMVWITQPLSTRFRDGFNSLTGYNGVYGGYILFFFIFILIPTLIIGLIIFAIGVKFKWWLK